MMPEPDYEDCFGTARWLRKYTIRGVVELCLMAAGGSPPLSNPKQNRSWCFWISRCKDYATKEMDLLRSCGELSPHGKWFQFDPNGEWYFEFRERDLERIYDIVMDSYWSSNERITQ